MLEIALEASCGESVTIVAGSVVAAAGVTVTVTVTVGVADDSGVGAGVAPELLDGSEEVDEFVPLVEPEASAPARPPLAPVALMIERALFLLVHVKIYDIIFKLNVTNKGPLTYRST
jgi:hypothetical protein